MLRRGFVGALVAIVVILGGACFTLVYKPAIAPLPSGQVQPFDAALIAHGAELVALGDCASCHSSAGGRPFAGGVAVPTPFGTIYSSNITPDRETGIGAWSQAAFVRAMSDGVSRTATSSTPPSPMIISPTPRPTTTRRSMPI